MPRIVSSSSVHLTLGAALLTMTLLFGACRRAQPMPTPPADSPRPLRVGVAESAPPLIFKQDGRTVGLEADLAQALGQELGREVRIVSIWWPDLIFELRKNHIDIIMAGMSITRERRREVAFCEPYLRVGQQALIRAADRERFATEDAVRGHAGVVGAEENTTGEDFARANLLLSQVRPFRSLDAAIRALRRGDIDLVIHDSPTVQWLAHQSDHGALVAAPALLSDERLAWAVRRENDALREQVNTVLARWRESGRLDEIIRRWLPDHPKVP